MYHRSFSKNSTRNQVDIIGYLHFEENDLMWDFKFILFYCLSSNIEVDYDEILQLNFKIMVAFKNFEISIKCCNFE